jgi:hypothetical protein
LKTVLSFIEKVLNKEGKEKMYTFKVLNSMDTMKPEHAQAENAVMRFLSKYKRFSKF